MSGDLLSIILAVEFEEFLINSSSSNWINKNQTILKHARQVKPV